MAAYVIVEIEVSDPVGYEEYRKLAGAAVAVQGGKFLVRGGKIEALEGDWRPERLVVLEFPSVERAKGCGHQANTARRGRSASARPRPG